MKTIRNKLHNKPRTQDGFSLIELMFALTIFAVVVAGVLPMYIQSSSRLLKADAKLDVNDSIRRINDRIISEAREAEAFILYDSFQGAWIEDNFVDFRSAAYEGMGRLREAETGKFLLLLFYADDEDFYDDEPPELERMVGMYLDADENETSGSLRIFEKTDINTKLTLEENIPDKSLTSTHEVILEDMTGLMDGDVFYNFSGLSVMISGKIKHESGAVNETNTYNFTITPR